MVEVHQNLVSLTLTKNRINSTFASCRSKGVKGVKKLGQYFVAPETSVEVAITGLTS